MQRVAVALLGRRYGPPARTSIAGARVGAIIPRLDTMQDLSALELPRLFLRMLRRAGGRRY